MQSLQDIFNESGLKAREFETFNYNDIKWLTEAFIAAFKIADKTFDEYEHLPEYTEIIEWLADTKGKGLFMTGSFGRGKTTILEGVLPLLFRAIYNKVLHPMSATELGQDLGWSICIDDIGTEEIVNNWGNKIDPVEYAISHCEKHTKLLIMTGNLNAKQLNERYGGRILDRITRLCKVVEFKGKSKRI